MAALSTATQGPGAPAQWQSYRPDKLMVSTAYGGTMQHDLKHGVNPKHDPVPLAVLHRPGDQRGGPASRRTSAGSNQRVVVGHGLSHHVLPSPTLIEDHPIPARQCCGTWPGDITSSLRRFALTRSHPAQESPRW